jgi:hypothetical protein
MQRSPLSSYIGLVEFMIWDKSNKGDSVMILFPCA